MKGNTTFGLVLAIVALVGCGEDRVAPTTPKEGTPDRVVAEPLDFGTVLAEDAVPCPCWSSRSLTAAFPTASFFFEDLAAEAAAGRLALQLDDIANVRVLQALVVFDPEASAAGDNWCQVGTYGQEGLERESISAMKISAEEFASCVTLLQHHAENLGVNPTR